MSSTFCTIAQNNLTRWSLPDPVPTLVLYHDPGGVVKGFFDSAWNLRRVIRPRGGADYTVVRRRCQVLFEVILHNF
jgi:hypothetical protein